MSAALSQTVYCPVPCSSCVFPVLILRYPSVRSFAILRLEIAAFAVGECLAARLVVIPNSPASQRGAPTIKCLRTVAGGRSNEASICTMRAAPALGPRLLLSKLRILPLGSSALLVGDAMWHNIATKFAPCLAGQAEAHGFVRRIFLSNITQGSDPT
jgi:hypothetical protein